MNYAERRRAWKAWHRRLQTFERRYLPRIQKALSNEAQRFIREAEQVGFQTAFKSLRIINDDLLQAINSMHKAVARDFGAEANRELKRGQKVSFFNANFILNITEILTRQALDLLTLVEQTTKQRILDILVRQTAQQWSFAETARQITREVASPARALTITRTESNRAANLAKLEAARLQPFVVTKQWISVIDNRTRRFREKDEFDHAILDGRVAELDEPFTQIGSKGVQAVAQCPCDPAAPAAFTINCRCVFGLENKRDAQGRLIPK
jgi:hypothetical protein